MSKHDYQNLKNEISDKTDLEVRELKEKYFSVYGNFFADQYAWKNGDRKKPLGTSSIESGVCSEIQKEFKNLFEPDIAREVANQIARYYY